MPRFASAALMGAIAVLTLGACAEQAPVMTAQGKVPYTSRQAITDVVASGHRDPANVARDQYRHPVDTLAFFGIAPGQDVVEIWPGGGWYTEILAPLTLTGGGQFWAAAAGDKGLEGIRKLIAKEPERYQSVRFAEFPNSDPAKKVPDGSADIVLTFRNVHNWRFGGKDKTQQAFREMYTMLRPGGVLGVVEHRLPEEMASALEEKSGYMKKSSIIAFAEQAGFQFAGETNVNANAKDTHDHPAGVWTLPPTLKLGDKDRAKYLAIGESDRMTLKFVKPR